MMMGEDIDDGCDDGVERSENCGEVEHRWKIPNTSSLEQVHDPVLSLSQGESIKEDPKNNLLTQAVG